MYSKNNFLTTCKHRQAKFRRFLVICWFRQLFFFSLNFRLPVLSRTGYNTAPIPGSCLPFTKSFRFLSFQWKISGSNWTSEKLGLFFGPNVPRIRVPLVKSYVSYQFQQNWFVQMINPIPVLNSSYHLPKPCNDRFSCVNGKQPVYLDFSSFWSQSKRAIGTLLSTDFMINFLSELTNIRWEIENRIFVGKTSTISFCIKD